MTKPNSSEHGMPMIARTTQWSLLSNSTQILLAEWKGCLGSVNSREQPMNDRRNGFKMKGEVIGMEGKALARAQFYNKGGLYETVGMELDRD